MNRNSKYILVAVIVVLGFLFYPSNEESPKLIQKEIIQESPIEEIEEPIDVIYSKPIDIKKVEPQKKIVKRIVTQKVITPDNNGFVQNIHTSDVIDIYNLEVEEKVVTLFNTIDNKNKYSISLKSSQKITSILPGGSYIQINGTLEDSETLKDTDKKSQFTLSFNEYYKDYIQDTYIEVTNKETNTTSTCDGSFLGAIEPQYRYFITLDFYEKVLSCYMNSEEDINEKGNQLPKDLNISNKSLPPMKERTIDGFFKTNQPKGKTNGNIN